MDDFSISRVVHFGDIVSLGTFGIGGVPFA